MLRTRLMSGIGLAIGAFTVVMSAASVLIHRRIVATNSTADLAIEFREEPTRPVSSLFDPALASQLLDDPNRDLWQQPDRIVNALRLQHGESVADVGAGSGYLMSRLSRAVGQEGIVYSEEIQPEYLPTLRKRARPLKNVRVVLGVATDPRLPRVGVDCFVLLTVYHEVQHPVEFLRALQRSARPGARLAIIDFDARRHGAPPAPDGHEIAEATVIEEARKAGWVVSTRHDFISSQFLLVFQQAR